MSFPTATTGFPTYSGPSADFPQGPLDPLHARGAAESQNETAGAVASGLKALLADGGFNEKSSGIGAHADHSA